MTTERKPTPAGYVPYVERGTGPFRPSRILDWGVRPGFHDAPPDRVRLNSGDTHPHDPGMRRGAAL